MILDDIALTMHPLVGCRTAIHLMACFGSTDALFSATEAEIIQRAQLKPALARSICRREYHAAAERELVFAQRNRLRVIACSSPEYPQRLLECPDYPHVLYVRGEADLNRPHMLSVVGTRKMTPYGRQACERLVGELGELLPDAVIVSGLAYGVDITAHRAAMQADLTTVAVLGHPLTHIFPTFHTDSARRIVEQGGALVSEFFSTSSPGKSGFVQRNRVIAALSDGVVIVESPARGGSLITAEMADGYDRTVMAVPGRVGEENAAGPNRLIRSLKGQMVCSGRDIIELLGWDTPLGRRPLKASNPELPFFDPPLPVPPREDSARPDFPDAATPLTEIPPCATSEETPTDTLREATPPVPEEDPQEDLRIDYHAGYSVEESDVEAVLDDSEGPTNELPQLPRWPKGSAAARLMEFLADEEPRSLEELSLQMGIPHAELSLLLLDMEFSGAIRMLPGKRYAQC